MNLRSALFVAWLATAGLVLGQPSRPGEPSSAGSVYGAGPSTQPQMFQKPPSPVVPGAAANSTGNTTTNNNAPTANLGGNLPPSATPAPPTGIANATVPNANGTLNSPAPVNTAMSTGPDFSSFPLPVTMDTIDNDHKLTPGDQIVLQIVEDREPPMLLLVDEKGLITVPWINVQEPVGDETLRTAANHIKDFLGNSTLQYYKDGHPTVLAAYYHSDNSRGRVYVIGAVQSPGYVPIPADKTLTLWDAIQAAKGFRADADQSNVVVIHHDSSDNTKPPTRTPVDIAGGLKNGQPPTMLVQPGDFISVSSRDDTSGTVTVSGKGAQRPGVLSLAGDSKLTVSKAILQVGWDNFSKLSDVHINRIKRDPKTGAPILDPKTGAPVIDVINVDVDEIINKGNAAGKDVILEKDDWIIVDQKWISF